jgi:hypothetical protein
MCAFGYHDKCETPNECRNPNSIYRCPVCSKKYGKKEAQMTNKCDWCGEEVDRVVPAPFPEVGWICERCYLNYKPKKEANYEFVQRCTDN